ncbi:hypothetical protein QBC46DRAFT_338813 [Diplogelasinospora grovesii]|uniref:Uncharacterized protein n=1 Tax=Diplogelasinospora grovesii TaxID=303347 RepID=A0AAN6NDA7_9PEZI|nr:hypothetical protein QBC46DRAFT_338813 [Diplogelasinospora grovesii]
MGTDEIKTSSLQQPRLNRSHCSLTADVAGPPVPALTGQDIKTRHRLLNKANIVALGTGAMLLLIGDYLCGLHMDTRRPGVVLGGLKGHPLKYSNQEIQAPFSPKQVLPQTAFLFDLG